MTKKTITIPDTDYENTRQRGQSLPVVLILAAVLSILGTAMVFLFQTEIKFLVKHGCMMEKQELAAIAIEHTVNKLQKGSNWYVHDVDGFNYYEKEYTTDIGFYTVHVAPGNLFLTVVPDGTTRQAQDEYKTIGIKVKTKTSPPCLGYYYALVKKMKYGGPLVSKGKIDLPANDTPENYNFYWGDVFSSSTNDEHCRYPAIPIGKGSSSPQEWVPRVFAKGAIYTAVDVVAGRSGYDFIQGYVYDDMDPTAHSHPYSEFAIVPEIDFDYFKSLAQRQGTYYGPPNIPELGANPYYISDGAHDIADIQEIASKSAATLDCDDSTDPDCSYIAGLLGPLDDLSSVLFIDTTDGLPITSSTDGWNTYSNSVTVSANSDGCGDTTAPANSGSLRMYCSDDDQYTTQGTVIVMGPLMMLGNEPATISNGYGYSFSHGATTADDITGLNPPDNYYFPQSDAENYDINAGNPSKSVLKKVKHHGIIYAGGELQIGGERASCGGGGCDESEVVVLGTLYIGEQSSLSVDTDNDDPVFYIYYDESINIFGFYGNSIMVVSFNEWSFLIPIPGAYPSSF